MGEHEGHAAKSHPIGAIIMVLIISGLMTYVFSLADSMASALLVLPFLLGFGLFVVFGLANVDSDEH